VDGTSVLYADFGRRLRRARRQARLSQSRLAELVGLSRTSVTNIERGHQHFPMHMLHRFAEALHVRAVELLPDLNVAGEVEQITEKIRRSLKTDSTQKFGLGEQNVELLARVLWAAQADAAEGASDDVSQS